MQGQDRRFIDRDVRENDHLHRIATKYLEQYTGEFYVLLQYKELIALGHVLNTSQARTVLNCMRVDPQVVDLTPPARKPFFIDFSEPSGQVVQEVEPVRRPVWIDLKTRWRKPYGISRAVNASKVHVVAPDSHFEYRTSTGEFRPRLRWKCKTFWNMPRKLNILLLSEESMKTYVDLNCDCLEGTHTWSRCAQCFELR